MNASGTLSAIALGATKPDRDRRGAHRGQPADGHLRRRRRRRHRPHHHLRLNLANRPRLAPCPPVPGAPVGAAERGPPHRVGSGPAPSGWGSRRFALDRLGRAALMALAASILAWPSALAVSETRHQIPVPHAASVGVPTFRGAPTHIGFHPGPQPRAESGEVWRFDTGRAVLAPPEVVDGVDSIAGLHCTFAATAATLRADAPPTPAPPPGTGSGPSPPAPRSLRRRTAHRQPDRISLGAEPGRRRAARTNAAQTRRRLARRGRAARCR